MSRTHLILAKVLVQGHLRAARGWSRLALLTHAHLVLVRQVLRLALGLGLAEVLRLAFELSLTLALVLSLALFCIG